MNVHPLNGLSDIETAVLEKHAGSVILAWAGGFDPVMVVRRKYEGKDASSPGGPWAIFYDNRCFNRLGEWEWEPMPSGRTDEFLERCRFESLKEAVDFWRSKEKTV